MLCTALGADPPETCKRCGYIASNDLCVGTRKRTPLTCQKACALLQGLEAGLSSAQRTHQLDTALPEGQRTIPKFERKLRVAESTNGVEGVERAVKTIAIE